MTNIISLKIAKKETIKIQHVGLFRFHSEGVTQAAIQMGFHNLESWKAK